MVATSGIVDAVTRETLARSTASIAADAVIRLSLVNVTTAGVADSVIRQVLVVDAGATPAHGSLSATLPPPTIAATATLRISASLVATLPPLQLAATAITRAGTTGALVATLPPPSILFTATVETPPRPTPPVPPCYTAEEHLAQFQRLLPRGRVWHRGWGWRQDAYLLALMPTWARLQCRLGDLIAEIFPCSTDELLPEWEATLGLPDPCIGPLDSVLARQRAVCAKFMARGGQSAAYFIAIAEALGYPVEIRDVTPARCGWSKCGDPALDEAWAFAWAVVVPSTTIRDAACGTAKCGDPLRSWGEPVLECIIRELAPAHTVVIFQYLSTHPPLPDPPDAP